MKFIDLIEKCIQEKKNVMVNGMPEESDSNDEAVFGRITRYNGDFLTFEVNTIFKDEKKENKKEILYIPTDNIMSLSFGTIKGLSDEEASKEFGGENVKTE